MAYKTGLTRADVEDMDIGQMLDYIDEYVKNMDPKKQKQRSTTRQAGQADFDRF
ncbi:hypothetical protein [Sporolactobacillus terrae]|uniref:Uncharacterized protein n=1 Tax=Sporolactobacillus terrae TaxID=269673 RepID=A0A5K7X5M6_9BACL|nr:hypothetical protein [Sporolactobacillus terrae]BBN99156.1 hypothetical protein St703_18610 [Sporolactobacillus terrae]